MTANEKGTANLCYNSQGKKGDGGQGWEIHERVDMFAWAMVMNHHVNGEAHRRSLVVVEVHHGGSAHVDPSRAGQQTIPYAAIRAWSQSNRTALGPNTN